MAQGNKGVKAKVQQLGSNLSSMVMPNIGAFIAWGSLPLYLFRMVSYQTSNSLQ
ncbi:hypothetical protein GCM10025885_20420 [Tetragenococcus osmophilus]|uniref:Uncharacterized protein n=1 Tax=Tetragenococcus osmophilus TaxID=526944 RepID=A0AA37XLY1_9ENTE|nr:hypothetical protein GCM10025885_20420 [Tetragenococcus osmophilus]